MLQFAKNRVPPGRPSAADTIVMRGAVFAIYIDLKSLRLSRQPAVTDQPL
jgi:hypothetical protein